MFTPKEYKKIVTAVVGYHRKRTPNYADNQLIYDRNRRARFLKEVEALHSDLYNLIDMKVTHFNDDFEKVQLIVTVGMLKQLESVIHRMEQIDATALKVYDEKMKSIVCP